MNLPWILCAFGLALGVLMGAALLIRPRQSHLSIGLASSPEKSGGVGESRAFGGMFVGLHGYVLVYVLMVLNAGQDAFDIAAVWAAPYAALPAAGWFCAALGRALSMLIDREGLALNARLLLLDVAMAALIAAPLWPFIAGAPA